MKKGTLIFLILVAVAGFTALGYFLVPQAKGSITRTMDGSVKVGQQISSPAPDSGVEHPEHIVTDERYGIQLAPYLVATGLVGNGEALSDLLYPRGVSMAMIQKISELPDTLIDERRIKAGNTYTMFLKQRDSTPAFFVYEKDALNYVVVSLDPDSVWARNGQKPVLNRIQYATGTIENSLWESMMESQTDPMLAVELSEIFAWTIDFFGLQEGDRYKVIYEESYVDSLAIGIHLVRGAYFYHNDHEFWAIPFVQNSVRSFFDEDGNSLRKAFLKAPLRFSRISSGFSNSRLHPILKIRRPHHGVDYVAPEGTPVHSVGDGVVTKVGYQKNGGGNYVKIKHNSVYSTTYMHLSRFGKGVHAGLYVQQGDVIGYVGKTGLATGPHLDFRFYKNGSAVNPLRVEAPPVEPVAQENLSSFAVSRLVTVQWLKLL